MARHGTTTVEAKTRLRAGRTGRNQGASRACRGSANRSISFPVFFRLPREQDGLDTFPRRRRLGVLRNCCPKSAANAVWPASPTWPGLRSGSLFLLRALPGCRAPTWLCAARSTPISPVRPPPSLWPCAPRGEHRPPGICHRHRSPFAGGFRCHGYPAPCGSSRWRPGCLARALIDAGVPVALGTNFNPHRDPTLSMQTVVAIACLRLRMTAWPKRLSRHHQRRSRLGPPTASARSSSGNPPTWSYSMSTITAKWNRISA